MCDVIIIIVVRSSPSKRIYIVFSLFKSKAIAANNTTEMITQPIILLENEVLKAQAVTADRLHVVVSLLEINRD